MPSTVQLDACGRRRSPATLSSFHQGRPPRNKGQRYPADPPTVEEIIAVMHAAGSEHDAVRLRALIIVLWRAGLRISEALALSESDLDLHRGAILVRRGKGGKRREVGMDRWAWEQLGPWLQLRATLPVGALFCVLRGPTAGRPWAARRRPVPATPRRGARGCATPVRASPTQTRPRGGDVARRRAAAGHPTPARARRSRDHVGLPARDRQHRDRPRCPRTPGANDPGNPRSVELICPAWWAVSTPPTRPLEIAAHGFGTGRRRIATSPKRSQRTSKPDADAIVRTGLAAEIGGPAMTARSSDRC